MIRKGLILAVGLLGLIVGPFIVEATPPEVRLAQQVQVNDPVLTLGDLAKNQLGDTYASMEISRHPDPGEARLLSRAHIIMEARRQNLEPPSFVGSNVRVHVSRTARTLPREKLEPRVREVLREKVSISPESRIKIVQFPDRVTLAPGEWSLTMDEPGRYEQPVGKTWYRIDIRQGEQVTESFQIAVEIRQDTRVPVAVEPLKRGNRLKKSAITWEQRDLLKLTEPVPTPEDNIGGRVLTRTIRPGGIINLEDLRLPTIVERREPVVVRYVRGNLEITVKGEALEDGSRGDVIEVENLSSEQTVYAEVIGEREVRVNQ